MPPFLQAVSARKPRVKRGTSLGKSFYILVPYTSFFSQTVYCWVLNSFLRGVQLFPGGGVRLSGCLHFICLPAWQFICLPVWLVVSGSPDVSLDLFSWAEGFLAVSHLSSTRPVNMLALTIQHGVLLPHVGCHILSFGVRLPYNFMVKTMVSG